MNNKSKSTKSLHSLMQDPMQVFLLSQVPQLELPLDFPMDNELRFLADPTCLTTLKNQIFSTDAKVTRELKRKLLKPNVLSETQIDLYRIEQQRFSDLESLSIRLHKVKMPEKLEGINIASPA
jgi:hypothetical protein